jgi:hypothetical protein
MAKKKTKGKDMPTETENATHAVRLDLPTRSHRLLRRIAADEDISMATYARDLLIEHLEAKAKEKGIKL